MDQTTFLDIFQGSFTFVMVLNPNLVRRLSQSTQNMIGKYRLFPNNCYTVYVKPRSMSSYLIRYQLQIC